MGAAPVLFALAFAAGLAGLFMVLTQPDGPWPGIVLGGAVLLAFLGVRAR